MAVTTNIPNEIAASNTTKVRLEFLDGLRGLAALFVVLHHIWRAAFDKNLNPGNALTHLPSWYKYTEILKHGHYAVAVFIVLSGFCLMLPLVRARTLDFSQGITIYLKRRSRRLLPPYYAALALSLIALFVFPSLRGSVIRPSDLYSPTHFPAAVIAHAFLVHNLNDAWVFQINGPMWSVATEWQIYFIFPFLLLPLFRSFGRVVPIFTGTMLGLMTLLIPHLEWACLWYIGLFAMGMSASVLEPSTDTHRKRNGLLITLFWIVIGILTIIAIKSHPEAPIGERIRPMMDIVAGAATALLLAYCYRNISSGKTQNLANRFLSSRVLVFLGGFSYSLYLTHYPLLFLLKNLFAHSLIDAGQMFLALVGAGLPIILFFSYLFHLAFERRFMNLPPARKL